MRLKNRRLTALAAVPLAMTALTALGSLPVMAAGKGPVAASSGGAGPLDRAQLGLALVTLGLLIFALTVVRLRMQSRRTRSAATARSRWSRVTDTYAYSPIALRRKRLNDSYAYSGMPSSRTNSRSRW